MGAVDEDGRNIVHHAARSMNHLRLLRVLLPFLKRRRDHNTNVRAVHIREAVGVAHFPLDLVKLIVGFECDLINAGDTIRFDHFREPVRVDSNTPLMLLCQKERAGWGDNRCCVESARLLIAHGANPDCRDSDGRTALDRCAIFVPGTDYQVAPYVPDVDDLRPLEEDEIEDLRASILAKVSYLKSVTGKD